MTPDVTPPPPAAAPAGRLSIPWKVVWLALAGLAVGVGVLATFGYRHWQNRGAAITIHFQEVHGIRPGAQVRFRGMVVGEVTDVLLRSDHSGIDMKVRLPPETASLAQVGSRFWIVRPTANFATGIGGLETLIGDQYIAVIPSDSGVPAADFTGEEDPPLPAYPRGSLRIVLNAKENSFFLRPGAPIYSAGVLIGGVRGVELVMPGGRAVRAEAFVEANRALLVKQNSVFRTKNPFVMEADTKYLGIVKIDIRGIAGGVELLNPGEDAPPAPQNFEFTLDPPDTAKSKDKKPGGFGWSLPN